MTFRLKYFGPMTHCAILLALSGPAVGTAEENSEKPTSVVKGPLTPEESLKHFVLADPNLQIEIVAAEPEVIDPVAIQFDEHGRLWVVELSDYPNGPEPGKPPMSRIKLLEDKDGDGRYETAHIFADKLLFATGVQPWDGGVIVTLAGEVAYFKDTDGDHKADVRETWFTGFAQANPQLRANHPTFGPDGWIYVANGLRGGNVIAVKKDWPSRLGLRPDPSGKAQVGTESQPTEPQPVSLTGRDFKFDPLTGRYEAISGNGQFGMTFDAWGNRFVCDNRHPCRHVIFEEDFIKRCPHVAFPAVVHDVIPADDKNQVFPLTSAWTTSNLHAGTFTAACGVTVYTGDWLPEEFRGNVFVCEPTGNLVQRAILEPDGVTFKSRRSGAGFQPASPPTKSSTNSTPTKAKDGQVENLPHEVEFLASRDDWFRPVDLQNGPDGALYVVDMYRAVIEHPEWVPDELKKRPDTWLGNDKGRIYRIRPSSPVAPRQEQPNAQSTPEKQSTPTARSDDRSRSDRATLGKTPVTVADLDSSFNSTNGWHRMTATRLIHERASSNDSFPVIDARCDEAVFLTANSKRLRRMIPNFETVKLLASPNGHLRAAALAILADGDDDLAYRQRARILLAHFMDDESALVRFKAFQLFPRRMSEPKFEDKLWHAFSYSWVQFATEGTRNSSDPWFRQAFVAVSSVEPDEDFSAAIATIIGDAVNAGNLVVDRDTRQATVDGSWATGREYAEVLAMLGEQVGAHFCYSANETANPQDKVALWDVVEGKVQSLGIYASSLRLPFKVAVEGALGIERGLNRSGQSLSRTDSLFKRHPDWTEMEKSLGQQAIERLNNSMSDVADQVLAARLVRLAAFETAGATLKHVAESATDRSLRQTALESFASFHRSEVMTWLIDRYRSETPAIRRAILAALFASKERQLRLLEAIEQGQIAATELDPVRVNQLTQAKDETLRERAKTILVAAAPASRKEVLDAYQPALALKADPKRGRELFVKNCSTCHRVDNVGVNVAPDISDTRTKKPEQLLLDIVDPNKAIDANYFAYAVALKDGTVQSGVISAETATSITLKQPEGKVLTLLRSDIEELRNTGLSLMPVGLEKNVDQQAMADLIFWLKNWRYLDGKVPATSLK